MNTYLIKLKPVRFFFFGMEKRSELGNRTNYFQRSDLYPQQTALLGLLRYIILQQENKLNVKGNSVKDLIGESSFEFNKKTQKFGKIKSLRPVFIIDNENNHYHTLPMDYHYNLVKVNGIVNKRIKEKQNKIYHLDGYSEKIGIKKELINTDLNIVIPLIKENGHGVFSYFTKSGNQKLPERFLQEKDKLENKIEEARREAYFKQEFVYMDNKYSFAFYADIDYEFDNEPFQVTLGKEKSLFTISFFKLNDVNKELKEFIPPVINQKYNSITFTSNTFVKESIMDKTIFAVTETVEFRNIIATVKTTKKYNNLSRDESEVKDDQLRLSNKLELIKKGSVIFFDSKNDVKEAAELITKQHNFHKIGYNYFHINLIKEE